MGEKKKRLTREELTCAKLSTDIQTLMNKATANFGNSERDQLELHRDALRDQLDRVERRLASIEDLEDPATVEQRRRKEVRDAARHGASGIYPDDKD